MPHKITLLKIIEAVLEDKGVEPDDSDVRRLRRGFNRLIEKLGGDKEALKSHDGIFEFQEAEIPFMKTIIAQLYDDRGLVAQFANERNRNKNFSSKDVHLLIQSILDEADKDGASEEDLTQRDHPENCVNL